MRFCFLESFFQEFERCIFYDCYKLVKSYRRVSSKFLSCPKLWEVSLSKVSKTAQAAKFVMMYPICKIVNISILQKKMNILFDGCKKKRHWLEAKYPI